MLTRRGQNGHCLLLSGKIEDAIVVSVYKHPRFPNKELFQILESQLNDLQQAKVIVVGDFNIDLKLESNKFLLDFFQKFNLTCKQDISESTTEYNSLLDVCFSNIESLTVSVYENYYSYHKGLSIAWKR